MVLLFGYDIRTSGGTRTLAKFYPRTYTHRDFQSQYHSTPGLYIITNRKHINMPTGSCFCGNIKVEWSGEPAMTVC